MSISRWFTRRPLFLLQAEQYLLFDNQYFLVLTVKDISYFNRCHSDWSHIATAADVVNHNHEEIAAGYLLNYKWPEKCENTQNALMKKLLITEQKIIVNIISNVGFLRELSLTLKPLSDCPLLIREMRLADSPYSKNVILHCACLNESMSMLYMPHRELRNGCRTVAFWYGE